MQYRKLGHSDIDISVVSIGAWAIGGDSNWGPSDDDMSIRTIHKAREMGINLLDTAPAYGLGHSEEVVGRAIKGRRSDYVLSTKCGLVWDGQEGSLKMSRDGVTIVINLTPQSIRRQVETSLQRLQTDYIDILITHWQSIEPLKTPISETMLELNRLVSEGKIRAIGISNVTTEDIDTYCRYGKIALAQQKYSMLDRTNEKTILPACEAHGITFQAYSPLERGVLTGKVKINTEIIGAAKNSKWFQPEHLKPLLGVLEQLKPLCSQYNCTMTNLIIAWTAAQSPNMNVLCGARKVDQVADNALGGSLVLDPVDLAFMNETVQTIL